MIRLYLLAITLSLILAVIACDSDYDQQERLNGLVSKSIGNAPAIEGETFSHGNFSLELQKGKPVLVNFWFPSCPPCRAEMPHLQETFEKYHDKVTYIGVQQLGLDSAEDGATFMEDLGLTYPSMPDIDSTVQKNYEVFSFPTTVFIDKNHDVARVWTGIINKEQVEQLLEVLLTSQP